ncbi:hypothetical protein [Pelosinus propionicus]|uniref:Uncharacterized protein n=1 Tax=Pelosinus propionicus DSM 13327 TaxID=1123291 RepID=A0A1I4Q4T5_9FIRM|nr:hypothetical protein [Pelosinus propionicus]SFM34643.1 hypothetical protein SAMN04490355_108211 [Pelosinus propionicus DSM 13327]
MKKNIKPLTPRCGICKKIYSYRDDDGSGLCPRCRPTNSQPLLAVTHKAKSITETEADIKMDDFDKEEVQEATSIVQAEENQGASEVVEDKDSPAAPIAVENNDGELKIEDIIEPGRYGVSNSQMIPALKKAIVEESIPKIALLKSTYFYTFEKSVRYLKKTEREYIVNNLK